MSSVERLEFKIELSGTFWDKKPDFSIYINDELMSSGTADNCKTIITFSSDFAEDKTHTLKIRLDNKTDDDTVVGKDGSIIKDMLLNIDSISIDSINLDLLKWSESEFIPDDLDRRPIIKRCVNLGWNGAYTLSFTLPFYIWLLSKM